MNDFAEFLSRLFQEGEIVFPGRPQPLAAPSSTAPVPPEALQVLERAFTAYRLDVAGQRVEFDAGLAAAAAEVLRQASWALVCRQDRVEDLQRLLKMPHPPATAAHHLSADLLLRYLPQVHRRARAIAPSDPLVGLLERVLRQWPLSGVLAGLSEGPESPPDLAGHEGLMLLYAERLAQTRGATRAWWPTGRALEYVDLVAGGTGRD
jgi:hypothetical protein